MKFEPQTPPTVTKTTYIKLEHQTRNLVVNNKHNPQAKLLVLKWKNQNPNITTVEMLIVLLQ